MSSAAFASAGNGVFRVSGPLGFESVPAVWEQSRAAFNDATEISIDMAGVTEVDSAGLALVIEWLRDSRGKGRRLSFTGMPEKLHALARMSEVEGFIEGAATHDRP